MLFLSADDYEYSSLSTTVVAVIVTVVLILLWFAGRPKKYPQVRRPDADDNECDELDLVPSWIPGQLLQDGDAGAAGAGALQSWIWPLPPHVWRSAAEPAHLKGKHRHLKQPYYPDCIWEVDPGPCRVWKWPSSSSLLLNQRNERRSKKKKDDDDDSTGASSHEDSMMKMMIAHYKWDSSVFPRAALIMLHGLGSHTMFQFLQRAPDGNKLRRGLYYRNSFVERCTETLGIACYGMDMEGHGFSFHHNHGHQYNKTPNVMYMQEGIHGVIMDVQRLLEYVRKQHGWDDYSNIFLIGHSTGCLAITRAIQELERAQKHQKLVVGGIILTAPFFGRANYHGSESFASKLASRSSLVAGVFYIGLGFLKLISKHSILSSAYTTKADDARNTSSCHPTVIVKSISPGLFIEKWVSGDRDLDPLFHSPYMPIYPALVQSTVIELRALFQQAQFTLRACPLLVIQSPYDPVVSYHAARRFVQWSASPDKQFYEPPEECHMLHNLMLETEGRNHVLTKIYEWLEERLPLQVV